MHILILYHNKCIYVNEFSLLLAGDTFVGEEDNNSYDNEERYYHRKKATLILLEQFHTQYYSPARTICMNFLTNQSAAWRSTA